MQGRTFVIGDIHEQIEKFEKYFIKIVKPIDTIYLLGDFTNDSKRHNSIKSYLYFWNLVQQNKRNDRKTPIIKLIRGNHEDGIFFDKKSFNKSSINNAHLCLKESNLKWYDNSIIKPTASKIINFVEKLPYKIELENIILVHGWINPKWNEQQHLKVEPIGCKYKEQKKFPDNYCWGSPAKINFYYKLYCKYKGFKEDKNSFYKFTKEKKDSGYKYGGYTTIEEYNEDIKKKIKKVVICGHWFNPCFDGTLEVKKWSHLYMIDGGIGYGETNNGLLKFKKREEKMNVLDITNQKDIKIL
ncbi:MAG: metallophosphoesterase [Mycoplasma sp.]